MISFCKFLFPLSKNKAFRQNIIIMSVTNDLVFNETAGLESQRWIMNLSSENINNALAELKFLNDDTQFAKAIGYMSNSA